MITITLTIITIANIPIIIKGIIKFGGVCITVGAVFVGGLYCTPWLLGDSPGIITSAKHVLYIVKRKALNSSLWSL